jgi:hypothetical protein
MGELVPPSRGFGKGAPTHGLGYLFTAFRRQRLIADDHSQPGSACAITPWGAVSIVIALSVQAYEGWVGQRLCVPKTWSVLIQGRNRVT